MEASLYIPVGRVRQFQELVKRHNLRFRGNPLPSGDRVYVTISAEHLPPGGANAFFSDWDDLNRPIKEVTAPFWKRLLRKGKGHLLSLQPT